MALLSTANTKKTGLERYMEAFGGFGFALPAIAGQYEGGKLVICGDSINVWDDLERFGARSNRGRGKIECPDWEFMVVNKLGETFPGNIEHWYSNEAHLLHKFVAARRNEYQREFGIGWGHSCNKGAEFHWPWTGHGSSGLGAVLTGIGLGYDEIMLCGMPLDDGPHNGEPHWRQTRFESAEVADQINGQAQMYWRRAIDYAFEGKVSSMSGRTKQWLTSKNK